jgi:hypothetical protein
MKKPTRFVVRTVPARTLLIPLITLAYGSVQTDTTPIRWIWLARHVILPVPLVSMAPIPIVLRATLICSKHSSLPRQSTTHPLCNRSHGLTNSGVSKNTLYLGGLNGVPTPVLLLISIRSSDYPDNNRFRLNTDRICFGFTFIKRDTPTTGLWRVWAKVLAQIPTHPIWAIMPKQWVHGLISTSDIPSPNSLSLIISNLLMEQQRKATPRHPLTNSHNLGSPSFCRMMKTWWKITVLLLKPNG